MMKATHRLLCVTDDEIATAKDQWFGSLAELTEAVADANVNDGTKYRQAAARARKHAQVLFTVAFGTMSKDDQKRLTETLQG